MVGDLGIFGPIRDQAPIIALDDPFFLNRVYLDDWNPGRGGDVVVGVEGFE
jgi:hypothetical protein